MRDHTPPSCECDSYVLNAVPHEWEGLPPETVLDAMMYMLKALAPQWERAGDSRYADEARLLVKHIRHFEQTGQHQTRGRPVGNRNMTAPVWRHLRQRCEDDYLNESKKPPRPRDVCEYMGLAPSTERQYRKDWGEPGHWKGAAALLTPEEIAAAVAAIWNNSQ